MTLHLLPRDRFDAFAKLGRDHGTSPDFQEIVVELSRRFAKYQKIGSPAVSETSFHRVDERTHKFEECYYIGDAGLTAHDVNYAILRVRRRKADGSDGDILFYAETTTAGTGNWTAFKATAIPKRVGTLTSSFTLSEGESLTFETTIAGTGVTVPSGSLMVFYR